MVADAAGRVLAVATGEVTPRAPLQHPAMVAIEKVAEEARKRPGFSLVDNYNGPGRICFFELMVRLVTFVTAHWKPFFCHRIFFPLQVIERKAFTGR